MPKPKKSKPIHKTPKNDLLAASNRLPDPQLTSLTDFVVSLTPTYTSKAIYTGGRILAVANTLYCSCDGSILIYQISSGEKGRISYNEEEEITNFGVSCDNKLLATYSNGEVLRVQSIANKQVLHYIKLPKQFPMDIVFSPDGKHLALGFANSHIKIYTTQTMKETHSYQPHRFGVKKVMWHPKGQLLQLISSDEDGTIVVFDYILNKVIGRAENAGKAFTLGSACVLSASSTTLQLYSYPSLSLLHSININTYIEHLHFLSDNLAIIGGDQTNLMSVRIGKKEIGDISPVQGCWDGGIGKILPLPGKKCAVVTIQQNIVILSSSLERQKVIVGYNDEILDIKHSKPNPSPYYILISNSPTFKIYNSSTNELHALVPGHTSTILACTYSHPIIITAGKDAVIRQWYIDEVGRVEEVARYSGHSGQISAISAAWISKTIISGGGDGVIKVWPLATDGRYEVGSGTGAGTGNKTKTKNKHITSSDGIIQIREANHTVQSHKKSINSLKISPKEDMIATCSHDRTIQLIDPTTLGLIFTLTGHRRSVHDTAFHPLQPLLLSCSGDGMLKCWSTRTFECLWSMGEGAALLKCEWIYFNQCVTVGSDGVLKLWDVRKKGSLSWDKHDGKIWALEVIKNKDTSKCEVITGGSDSTLQIWSDNTLEVRGSILASNEHDQQQQLLINQHMHAKAYLSAAQLAFKQNYISKCMQAIGKMLGEEGWQIKYDQQTHKMIQEEGEVISRAGQQEIKVLLKEMWQTDANRLLQLLLSMNSTVKHCHSAIQLLHYLLRMYPISKLLSISSTFSLPEHSIPKQRTQQSDFQIFLSTMLMYTQRHQTRIQRYVRGTYGIQQQIEDENML